MLADFQNSCGGERIFKIDTHFANLQAIGSEDRMERNGRMDGLTDGRTDRNNSLDTEVCNTVMRLDLKSRVLTDD